MLSPHTALQVATNRASDENLHLDVAQQAVCLSNDLLSLFVIGINQVSEHLYWWDKHVYTEPV
jgi:hypothetical protein